MGCYILELGGKIRGRRRGHNLDWVGRKGNLKSEETIREGRRELVKGDHLLKDCAIRDANPQGPRNGGRGTGLFLRRGLS